MLNDTDIDNLDSYIDSLQADTGLRSTPHWQVADRTGQHCAVDVSMLQMAAQLNSMRPGANTPDTGFTARLRERILAEAALSTRGSQSED